MKGILKWPLLIAAVFVIGRVLLEQLGAPESISNKVSAVALFLVVFPVWFALRIADSNVKRPYLTLLKTITIYAALVRAMIIPTYWLAYIFQWSARRFQENQAGVVGPGVTPLEAYLTIPFMLAIEWVIAAVIMGGTIGSVVLAIKRRLSPARVSA